jgi:hypothetical protein
LYLLNSTNIIADLTAMYSNSSDTTEEYEEYSPLHHFSTDRPPLEGSSADLPARF